MEKIKLNLKRAYECYANNVLSMLTQPNLNEIEKAIIFKDLGRCEMIKAILKTDFEDDVFGFDYERLQKQVFDTLV